jgi:flagellar assembly factor FliW
VNGRLYHLLSETEDPMREFTHSNNWVLQEFRALSLVTQSRHSRTSTNMHVVISDYWDIYEPEVVSAELVSIETGLPVVEPITVPGDYEFRVRITDPSGLG